MKINNRPEEIFLATKLLMRSEGNKIGATILKQIANKELANVFMKETVEGKKMSANEALSLLIEADLSVSDYQKIRLITSESRKIFPVYKKVY